MIVTSFITSGAALRVFDLLFFDELAPICKGPDGCPATPDHQTS